MSSPEPFLGVVLVPAASAAREPLARAAGQAGLRVVETPEQATIGLVDLTTDGEIIERTRHDATALLDSDERLVGELISDIDEEQSNYLDRS